MSSLKSHFCPSVLSHDLQALCVHTQTKSNNNKTQTCGPSGPTEHLSLPPNNKKKKNFFLAMYEQKIPKIPLVRRGSRAAGGHKPRIPCQVNESTGHFQREEISPTWPLLSVGHEHFKGHVTRRNSAQAWESVPSCCLAISTHNFL